jgi:SAM-dependent methyltransferase
VQLLEVGAGAGRNTPRYSGFQRIVLVDYSRTQLLQAVARLGTSDRYLYVAADVYRLPFAPGVFDAATMIRALHHMADPQAALRGVREAMRPGGAFVLEYANKRNLKAIGRWLLRRQSWNPFDWRAVEFVPLNFDFHPQAVRGWLVACGFDVERQLTVSHFRLPILKRLIPLGVLVGLDSLAQWTGDLWQLTPSVFVRARALGRAAPAGPEQLWRCPACGSLEVDSGAEGARCGNCGRLWAKVDGIYDFRVQAPPRD